MKVVYKRVTDGVPEDFSLTKPDTCTSCQRMQSGFFFPKLVLLFLG